MEKTHLLSDYCFRKATMFDIPYIFDLIVQSSLENGSFSDGLLTASGYIALLCLLINALGIFRAQSKGRSAIHELLIVDYRGESIGFLHCIHFSTLEGHTHTHIDKCAIASQLRGHGHGKFMIKWLIERQTSQVEFISAYCNRYVRAMQHIFKREHFVRKSVGRGLELYTLDLRQLLPAPDSGP